jgi:excinuclease ABC subunit C
MRNDRPVKDISDLGANRYPHFKLTAEKFPRILATRRVENDDDEYFGAFLTKTSVRILIDFINRTFKLRSCDIDIDGGLPVPCTQFYRRRCVAPCVRKLCSHDQYLTLVELARLFLSDQRGLFRKTVTSIIDAFSASLEFESAAKYRDILQSVEKYWKNARLQVRLDDAVDTYAVDDTPGGCDIFLVTHRNRSVLGRKVFTVSREAFSTSDEALSELIDSFYLYHLPKEIRVSRDFYGRRELASRLTRRFNRPAKISAVNPRSKGINAYRGLMLSHDEHELDRAKPTASPAVISSKLAKLFALEKRPERIQAFDVAHISGTGFVTASAVWESGRFLSADYDFILSDEKSELAALADGVIRSVAEPNRKQPDLILLDGGKNQLNKVLHALTDREMVLKIVAAVKPPGKHGSIAAFLTATNDPIQFDIDSPAHAMLQLLRDEAHDLANRIHRDYREMMPFYETAGHDKPLVVPLRFHAENGGAEDLIPIESR